MILMASAPTFEADELSAAEAQPPQAPPTVWGLTPTEVHDRFWAARGVQVVRCGEVTEIVKDAELFLLMAPRLLCVFRLHDLLDQLSWLKPDVMWVRLSDNRDQGYLEKAITDSQGMFIRMERQYGGDTRLTRVGLTPSRRIARLWQKSPDSRTAWAAIRAEIPRERRAVQTTEGSTYDRGTSQEIMPLMRQLVQVWKRPDATADRATRHAATVWADRDAAISDDTRFVGPAWVGAGRTLPAGETVVGPAVLWDAPGAQARATAVQWEQLEPIGASVGNVRPKSQPHVERLGKRAFDFAFALAALLFVLPIFPLVMLAIWFEDGRPFFFAHIRETRGGREFPCLKFRSMRKDAERLKHQIMTMNQVDGPQFYIDKDPRITRVGEFLRRFHIDELPQFFNVLAGHMSIVGPRPSPRKENQYCPPWREARLSVLPGVTGLWQVKRTRRQGLDFQEWIQFDCEYVEQQSFFLDLWIIYRTIMNLIARSH